VNPWTSGSASASAPEHEVEPFARRIRMPFSLLSPCPASSRRHGKPSVHERTTVSRHGKPRLHELAPVVFATPFATPSSAKVPAKTK
jgi:hypothetical protein